MKKDHYVQVPNPAAELRHDEEMKGMVITQAGVGSWKALDSMEAGNGLEHWDRKEGTDEAVGVQGNTLAVGGRMRTRHHSGKRENTCSQENFSQFND